MTGYRGICGGVTRLAAAAAAAVAALSAPVAAQTLVDSYVAEISPQDRVNSRGAALSDPAAILAQDRANYHRFGVRQAGDMGDGVFSDRAMRAAFPDLVARGEIAADARAAILGGGSARVRVEVLRGAGGDYVRVQLAGTAAPPAVAAVPGTVVTPEAPATVVTPAAPAPAFGLAAPGAAPAAGWALEDDPAGMRGIAGVRTASGARVALECTRPGADAAAFTGPGVLLPYQEGMLNLLVEAAAFPGLALGAAGQQYTVSLAIDGQPLGATAMAALPEAGALGTSIPATHPVFARLSAGTVMLLQDGGTGAQAMVPLSGLGAALAALGPVCAEPAGRPVAGAAMPPIGAAPQAVQPAAPAAPQVVAAPAASAPDASTVRGNDAVADRLALWLIGQRPGLLGDQTSAFTVSRADLPAGYPTYDPSVTGDPTYIGRLGQEIAARAASETVPGTIELDLRARLTRQSASLPFQLRLQNINMPLANYELQPSIPEAIRTVQIQLPFRFGQVLFRESAPLALVLPEALANMEAVDVNGQPALNAFERDGETLLRTTLALSDARVTLPVDRTRPSPSQTSAEIAARVEKVELILRTVGRDRPAEETVLATWDRGAAPAGGTAAPAFADRFARGLEDGRVSVASFNYREAAGLPNVIASTGRSLSEAREAAILLVKTASLLERYPDRTLSREALLDVLFKVVDPNSRDRIVPPGFRRTPRDSNMNELVHAQALLDAEPLVRAYVTANAPAFPMDIRMRSLADLGDYDLTSQRFAWRFPVRNMGFLEGYGTRFDLSGPAAAMQDTLAMASGDANTLIQFLETDAIPVRQVPIRLDYTITGAASRPGGSGEITLEEIGTVELGYRYGELRMFADIDEQVTLLSYVFPQEAELSDAERIPEAIYETSPEAVWATWARATGQMDQLQAYVINRSAFRAQSQGLSESQRAALAETETARVAGLALDRFWIGLSFNHGTYDPAAGRLEVRGVSLSTLPYRVTGRDGNVPSVGFARGDVLDALPMTPGDYAEFQRIVGGSRTAFGLALVAPAAGQEDARSGLTVTRPEVILLPEPQGMPDPERVALRIEVGAAPSLAPGGGAAALVPPERLLLDGEGLDLLALSQDPGLYGEAAFRRMLVERLALERLAAQTGEALPWGAFFADPGIAVRPGMIDAVLPAFTDWTRARAAALPVEVVVPYGVNGNPHPLTQCRAAQRLPAPGFATRAVLSGLAALVPGVNPVQQPQVFDQVARPGPTDVVAISGRAAHPNGTCGHVQVGNRRSDISPDATGIDYGAAGYVDALVVAAYPAVPRAGGGQTAALDYVVRVDEVALRPAAPGAGDQPGLRGVLVISGEVTAVDTYVWDSRTRSYPRGESIAADAWLSLVPDADAPLPDILGLTLGAPLAEVEALATGRIEGAIRHVSAPQAERRVYGDAVGFSAPDRSEVFLSIHDAADEAKPAIALMRYRYFDPGTVQRDAVTASLVEKYGEPDLVVGETLAWGVPPQEVDGFGVCGGQRMFSSRGAVPMAADMADEEERRLRAEGLYLPPEWGYYGWPIAYADQPPNYVEPARPFCGPAVLARVRTDVYEPGSVDLTVWLVDTEAAEARAAAAPAPEAAKIEL